MAFHRARGLGVVLLVASTASCAALLGFERLTAEGATDPTAEAGGDAANDGGGIPEPPECKEIGLPAPSPDAGSGLSIGAQIVALRLLDFGLPVDGGLPPVPGYNLDSTCTTNAATGSCTRSAVETTFDRYAKDKSPTGLDNAGFELIAYLSRLSSTLSAEGINAGITDGQYGAVLQLTDWNGEPNDGKVDVEVFPSIGFVPRAGARKPTFGPDDTFYLDDRYRVGFVTDGSTLRSTAAWVVENRLVARFKEISLPLFIAEDPKPFDVRIRDAILTAKLERTGETTTMRDGLITGRWKTADFLAETRTIYLADANDLVDTTLCEKQGVVLYGAVKGAVCDGPDIRSDSQDRRGLPCDAISAAARIEGYSVKQLGTWKKLPVVGPRCVDASVPLGDDCP
jgi:hypothetical protein